MSHSRLRLGELVPLGEIMARVFKPVEAAGLTFHCSVILASGGVPAVPPQVIRHVSPGHGGVCLMDQVLAIALETPLPQMAPDSETTMAPIATPPTAEIPTARQ